MSNLVKLLQPTTYKSKIKLYCSFGGLEVKKYSDLVVREEKKQYICITEIK